MEKDITKLIEIACYHYQNSKNEIDVTPENVLIKTNLKPLPEIRSIVSVLAKDILNYSVKEAEAIFGKTHTYLIYWKKIIKNLCETDKIYKSRFDYIVNEFKDYLERKDMKEDEIINQMGILIQ